jgi:hypothetical protein
MARFSFVPAMPTSQSSAPGPATPGGELQQISPGAWPTANGGQVENPAQPASADQSRAAFVPKMAPAPKKSRPNLRNSSPPSVEN